MLVLFVYSSSTLIVGRSYAFCSLIWRIYLAKKKRKIPVGSRDLARKAAKRVHQDDDDDDDVYDVFVALSLIGIACCIQWNV